VIERAVIQSRSAQKDMIDVADILVSLYDEERNYSAYYLRKAGIKRLELLDVLSHGIDSSGYTRQDGDDGKYSTLPDEDTGEGGQKVKSKRAALERFAMDLTALAREQKLEPFIGRRRAELQRLLSAQGRH